MSYDTIRVEVTDQVATLTLHRPERMNAYTAQMGMELGAALGELDADDAVRAIVITGAGRAFCAGADLGPGGDTFAGYDERPRPTREPLQPYQVGKPVIAAINGAAVGVGITYALLCDQRYVAEEAKVQFAFVRRGVIPELASHVLLPRVVGFSRAADLLLSGRMILGREAAELGLASEALPADRVLERAQERAREIAVHTAPVSVAIAKRLLWDGLTSTVPAMREREGRLLSWVGKQADAREGVEAFLEKREPRWKSSASDDLPRELLDAPPG